MRNRIQDDWKFKANIKMIIDNITPHIKMRTKVIYSFKSEIHRGAGKRSWITVRH